MSNLLKERHSLTKLRKELERGSCVGVVRSSGTWPVTAGTEEKEKRGKLSRMEFWRSEI